MVCDVPEIGDTLNRRTGYMHYDPRGAAERALWQAVLLAMAHDLCLKGSFSRARDEAEAWLGDYPTRHFKLICFLAGFDDEAVWDRLRQLRMKAPKDRYWPRGFTKEALAQDAASKCSSDLMEAA
jgi:hypothetical protein